MLIITFSIIFCILVGGLVGGVAWVLMKKSVVGREGPTPFECGFDPSSFSRLPLSIQFFLIAIIFLVFDVEVTLLLPAPLLPLGVESESAAFALMFIVIILLAGLYYEWKEGALGWEI